MKSKRIEKIERIGRFVTDNGFLTPAMDKYLAALVDLAPNIDSPAEFDKHYMDLCNSIGGAVLMQVGEGK